jgi:hypothetical protein
MAGSPERKKLRRDDTRSIFGTTPFGIHCIPCSKKVSEASVRFHIKSAHPELRDIGGSYKAFGSELMEKVNQKRATMTDAEPYLKGPSTLSYRCTKCSHICLRQRNAGRHATKVCEEAAIEKVFSRETICGRYVPNRDINRFVTAARAISTALDRKPSMPFLSDLMDVRLSKNPAVLVTQDNIRPLIAPFVRSDESVEVYASAFHRILSRCTDFCTLVTQYLDNCEDPLDGEDSELAFAMEVSILWITEYYRLHVSQCPANYRAAMVVSFDGQVVGDTNMCTTFDCRTEIPTLVHVLQPMIAFAWRNPTVRISAIKREFSGQQRGGDCIPFIFSAAIPRLLSSLIFEEPDSFFCPTVVERFCLSRCFYRRQSSLDDPIMRSCGTAAADVASVLHLLQAGVLSYLVFLEGGDLSRAATSLVNDARSSRVVNIISPMIRQFRDMQGRKPPAKDGLITVDSDILLRGYRS